MSESPISTERSFGEADPFQTSFRGALERGHAAATVDKMTRLLSRQVTSDFHGVLLDVLHAAGGPRDRSPPGIDGQNPSDELEGIPATQRGFLGSWASVRLQSASLRSFGRGFLRQLDAADRRNHQTE
jgi:hypothetical protein